MSSRLERVTLVPDDSDEERRASESSRRRDYYGTQRTHRPSTSTSHSTTRSKGRHVTYQEPDAYGNLDESAAPPPVNNPDDEPYYRREPGLEENVRNARSDGMRSRTSYERRESARRRRNRAEGDEELTEVAAPPPVQHSLDEDHPKDFEKQTYLEDEERGDARDDSSFPSHQQKQPEDYVSKEPEVPKWLTQIYTVSYLVFFALFGTLARLGTQWIVFYPGTPLVTPVIWANFGGSFVMGFLSEDQNLFRPEEGIAEEEEKEANGSRTQGDLQALSKAEATKRKKAIPLYIGLATGFCGSYTSFSSFARDFFLALSNTLPTPIDHPHPGIVQTTTSTVPRNGGYSFQAWLQVIISTIALSLGALIIGGQLAIALEPYTPRVHGNWIRKFLDPGMVVLGFGCWLGAVFLAIFPPDRPGGSSSPGPWPTESWRGEVLFALVFAPIGCLLRFYASLKLNGLVPSFPLGTFAVNMFGTAVEGMAFDLQHAALGAMGGPGGSVVGCQVLQGIMDGFCGCLTTVSTWVSEINGLQRRHGWTYAFGSVAGALALLLVIMGSVRWSVGYVDPLCDTGYTSKING